MAAADLGPSGAWAHGHSAARETKALWDFCQIPAHLTGFLEEFFICLFKSS